MKVAVIGAGIKGLVCSYVLAKAGVEVVLFEREEYLGSHRYRTITFDGFDLDLAIMVFNPVLSHISFVLYFYVFGYGLMIFQFKFQ